MNTPTSAKRPSSRSPNRFSEACPKWFPHTSRRSIEALHSIPSANAFSPESCMLLLRRSSLVFFFRLGKRIVVVVVVAIVEMLAYVKQVRGGGGSTWSVGRPLLSIASPNPRNLTVCFADVVQVATGGFSPLLILRHFCMVRIFEQPKKCPIFSL